MCFKFLFAMMLMGMTVFPLSAVIFYRHGAEGQLYGTDCMPVGISDLLAQVRPSRCKTLENKPKVFFIQACQGHLETEGIAIIESCSYVICTYIHGRGYQ